MRSARPIAQFVLGAWLAGILISNAQAQAPSTDALLHQVEADAEARGAVLGNPQGTTTLLEFYDFNCGPCREANAVLERFMRSNSNLRIVLVEHPILGPDSRAAAEVALQLPRPAYTKVYSAIMGGARHANPSLVLREAQIADVDVSKLTMPAPLSAEVTIANNAVLAERLGVRGVPSFYIDGRLSGGVDEIARDICGYHGPGTCSNYIVLVDDAEDAHRRGAGANARRYLAMAVADAQQVNLGDSYNEVCWDGALLDEARTVMPACLAAVAAAPDNEDYRDSRGLAEALVGDRAHAIADFQYFVDQKPSASRAAAARRTAITMLQSGAPIYNARLIALLRD